MTLLGILKTLRNNWKKSTFAALALSYGINFAKTKYEIMQMMRVYCEESKRYGEELLPVGAKPRHVTVIMNPSAKDGKGVALFDKYAVPILHLAGIRVSVIKTEYEGQAKALMDVMGNTDAVLVAGGDGTFLEIVTGLCRRDDVDVATQKFPLGILPIGRTNSLAKRLFWGDHLTEARLLAESAMAVVKGKTRPLNVMSVVGDSGKPVYAVSSLEWGRYRDVNSIISKYWYWGPLKSKMAYVFSTFKKHAPRLETGLAYTLPCDGCSKCYKEISVSDNVNGPPTSTRWWQAFLPRQPVSHKEIPKIDYSKVLNENCGEWEHVEVSAIDLIIETCNVQPDCKESGTNRLTVKIGPEHISWSDFILEGWRRTASELQTSNAWVKVISAKEVKLHIEQASVEETIESWFSIDNDNHEVKPVHVQLHPNKIKVFCKSQS